MTSVPDELDTFRPELRTPAAKNSEVGLPMEILETFVTTSEELRS
jgi:hypothetical protein